MAKENLILIEKLNKSYSIKQESSDLFEIIKTVGEKVSNSQRTLIGIDGPTGAGKTTISEGIENFLRSLHTKIVVIKLDWFLSPPESRKNIALLLQEKKIKIEEYSSITWQNERILELLNRIQSITIKKTPINLRLTKLYDRVTGKHNKVKNLDLTTNVLFLIEGVGIMSNEFQRFMDVGIWIDVANNDDLLDRKLKRELNKKPMYRINPNYMTERFYNAELLHSDYLRKQSIENCMFIIENSSTQIKLYEKHL